MENREWKIENGDWNMGAVAAFKTRRIWPENCL
jgi:hypothetical protein